MIWISCQQLTRVTPGVPIYVDLSWSKGTTELPIPGLLNLHQARIIDAGRVLESSVIASIFHSHLVVHMFGVNGGGC